MAWRHSPPSGRPPYTSARSASIRSVCLGPAEGVTGMLLVLQKVAERKQGKNRMHIDIPSHDLDADRAKLLQRLCRKFCSGGREGVVAPVGGEIRRPGRRTVRPQ